MQNVILSPIAPADLVLLIANEIENRLKNYSKEPASRPDEQKFNGDRELAAYLNCSVQTINQLKKKGQIVFHRMGRRCYYLRSEIDASLQVDRRKFGRK